MSDLAGPADAVVRRTAFHDGRWVDAASVAISAFDPAITQGVTAVERIRIYHDRMFQIDLHMQRWCRTVAALSITGLPQPESLVDRMADTIRRNQNWCRVHREYGLLLFASPGRFGRPTIVIDLYSIDTETIRYRRNLGSPVVITDVQQPSPNCWPRNIKVRCRLHYYLADRQATAMHPDAIGVLIDADGTVTESSIANLVIVEAGRLITPQDDQHLQGVSLQVVRELAVASGASWDVERITPDRMRRADEVLLTGSSCGIWFAHSVDGCGLPSPGPVYRDLRAAFDRRIDESK